MSKITVKVCGTSGSGKSTVAELLVTFLKMNDFNVEHIPQEELDWASRARNRDARFEAIKDNCEIQVVEVQLTRKGLDPTE